MRELAEQFGVNRITVREALRKLESMGMVEIKHGSGIFVKDFLESGSLELARYLLFVVLLNAFTSLTRDLSKTYFDDEANQQRSIEFHREIYAAIEAGDAANAKRIMADVLDFAEAHTWRTFGMDSVGGEE